jgi:nucleotide-binding universal stress UspA family protein
MKVRLRPENVLVATDFSRGAAAAIDRAGWLPLGVRPTLHVANVMPADVPHKLKKQLTDRVKEELAAATAKLSTAVEKRTGQRVKILPAVLRGEPFVEIIRYARRQGVGLIVIGRHGRRAVRDLFIGSTAERVVRNGDIPVLLANRPASRPYLRPLAAVDFSDTSRRVVELALALTETETRSMTLLHAYEVPFEGVVSWSWSERVMAEYRRECEEAAAGAAKQFLTVLDALDVPVRVVVRPGDPRNVIAGELPRRRSDLVVVGTHARSGLAHTLLGSVAEWVIRSARCDVGVTRPARFSFELP